MNTQAQKLKQITDKNRSDSSELKTKILSISSGKGGVGKSMIAANIAYLLSQRGYKVGIFDASIGLANLDIIFNVKIEKNLLNLLKGESSLEEIIIEINENLLLIPSESGNEILNFTNLDIYNKLMDCSDFLDDLDYLIIDTSSGIGEDVLTFLEHSDEVIVVTAPEPTAITDAYALIKVTAPINENLNLIVNSTESENEGRFIYERIKKVADSNLDSEIFLNFLGSIDTSRIVFRSMKLRELFTKSYPNSIPSYQLNEIVDNLILQLEHQAPIKRRKNSFALFFRRLIENI